MYKITMGTMSVQSIRKLAMITALLLTAAGCSGTGGRENDNQLRSTTPMNILYEVRRGDSLAKIAERMTGSGDNWQEIALINDIAEPKALQIGKVLTIPAYLVPNVGQQQLQAETQPIEPEPRKAEIPEPVESPPPLIVVEREKPAKPAKDWIFQPSSLPGVSTVDVVLYKANANRSFKITRTSEEAGDSSRRVSNRIRGQQIRVIGSYYPKGVYVQPSLGADLLMRVAPGTLLELEQSFGEWLQIRTKKGSGYIRANDAEVLSALETKQLLMSKNG